MTDDRYTPHVGAKFNADGSVRPFPGNTVICFAEPSEPPYQLAERAQQLLLAQPFARKYALLPPDSFHMTVFPMLCDQVRISSEWSSHLPLDCTLAEADAFIIERVNSVPTPNSFRMVFDGIAGRSGLSLTLLPADEETAVSLWTYRDALSEATGIRFPDHGSYRFHLSIAYKIKELTPAEHWQLLQYLKAASTTIAPTFGVFNTRRPHLTFFDDMFRFVTENERSQLSTRG